MPMSPLEAALTTASSSMTGRKSSRRAFARVCSAFIGQSASHPPMTKSVSAVAIPASTPSGHSVSTPTSTPITTPTSADAMSRPTAERRSRVLMLAHCTDRVAAM